MFTRIPGPLIALYAATVLAVPVAVMVAGSVCRGEAEGRASDPDAVADLAGVWRLQPRGGDRDAVQFYYFHGDGKGLYRYGKIGLNNTHSFDYDVVGGDLELTFRKTGESHRLGYRLEADGQVAGRTWLTLDPDPRGDGVRYFRDPDEPGPRATEPAASDDGSPAGHMWIDLQRYATGGMAFGFYQLREAGIDGRGVGWFHRGDFDEWSTEALVYRVSGDRLDLTFPVRGETAMTGFRIELAGDGGRRMVLDEDPRDFWNRHAYGDAGPSFGARAIPFHAVGLLTELDGPIR